MHTHFSCYAHPLRWWGRLIGRCLNQMVRASENYMPSLNMSDMKGMLSVVRYWNHRLTEQGDDPRTHGLPVELWELDVVQMYPSLDRAEDHAQDFPIPLTLTVKVFVVQG